MLLKLSLSAVVLAVLSGNAHAAALVPVGEATFAYEATTILSTFGPRFDGYGNLLGHESIQIPPVHAAGTSAGGLSWVRWLHARGVPEGLLAGMDAVIGGSAATALEVGEGGEGSTLVGYDNVALVNVYQAVTVNIYMPSWNKGEHFAGSTEDNELVSLGYSLTTQTPTYIQYQLVPRLGEEIGDEIPLRVETSSERVSNWYPTPTFEGENFVLMAPSIYLNGQAHFVEGTQTFTAHIGDLIGLSAGAMLTKNKNWPEQTGDLVVDMPRTDEYRAAGLWVSGAVGIDIPPTRGIAPTVGLNPTAVPEPGHFVFSDLVIDDTVGKTHPLWFTVDVVRSDYSLFITDNAATAIQLPGNLPPGEFYVGYSTGDEENLIWTLASASERVPFPTATQHIEIEGIPWDEIDEEDIPLTLSFGLVFASAGTEVEIIALGPPPAVAQLAYFHALKTDAQTVILSWGTMVEVDTLGFRLERWDANGGWTRVGETIIPAMGSDHQPWSYEVMDTAAAVSAKYRLLAIDFRGQGQVLAETDVTTTTTLRASVRGETLSLELEGPPNRTVSLESATNVARGPWEKVEAIQLDGGGRATASRELNRQEPMRFYRVSE